MPSKYVVVVFQEEANSFKLTFKNPETQTIGEVRAAIQQALPGHLGEEWAWNLLENAPTNVVHPDPRGVYMASGEL